MRFLFIALSLFIAVATKASDTSGREAPVVLHTSSGDIFGTLATAGRFPGTVALIISGSGPTDRNGNNPAMKNESLRMLAYALADSGISTLRYDKRGIAESRASGKREDSLRFDNYVSDAIEWIRLLKKDKRFNRVVVIGHSEGSLIGMVAARQAAADGFVSLAGAGRSANVVLKEQLSKLDENMRNTTNLIIDSLVSGHLVTKVNPLLFSLFRPSVQPYLISWFKYNPVVEIAKLSTPKLIVQGSADLQVSEQDARLLKAASKNASLVIIPSMNHVLKIVADMSENQKSYTDPDIPISPQLVSSVTGFIKKLR